MRSGRHQQLYSTWRSRPPASRGSPTAEGTPPYGCSTTPHTCADRHLGLKSGVGTRGLRVITACSWADWVLEDDRCPDAESEGREEVGIAQKMVAQTPAVFAAPTVGRPHHRADHKHSGPCGCRPPVTRPQRE